MPNSSNLEQKLKDLPPNFIVFLLSESVEDTPLKVLNYLLREKETSGIYIALDKPSKTIRENLIRNKTDVEKLYFIDLISEAAGVKPETYKDIFVSSPSNLTDLGIAIQSAIETLKTKNKFIIFDALSTLFNYNEKPIVLRFIHYLTARMRNFNIIGIFILMRADVDKATLSQFAGFADKTIEI